MQSLNTNRSRSIHYQGGNAIVVGMGRSGEACATFLLNDGWNVEVADVAPRPHLERRLTSALPGIMVHAPIYPQLFLNADLVAMSCNSILLNAGLTEIIQNYGARIVTMLDLFFERSKKPVVAISGTNGKSTVTALVEEIVARSGVSTRVGGSGGLPFLELLNSKIPDLYILELSPLHLEQVQSVSPDVATILNLTPDHLDRYSSQEHYVEVTSRVIRQAKTCVINRDDETISNLPTTGHRITFGLDKPERKIDFGVVEEGSTRWIVRGTEKLVNLNACQLSGSHNEMNFLAACAIADATGYSLKSVSNVITKFKGLPYRCSDTGLWNGVRWVNDARSTNVGATITAIQESPDPVVLIAGGLSKKADFSEVCKKVNGKLRGCVLFGRDSKEIGKSINGVSKKAYVENIYDAVEIADYMTEEGDRVVFSPGCASYDMFSDYRHRGKTFTKAMQIHFS